MDNSMDDHQQMQQAHLHNNSLNRKRPLKNEDLLSINEEKQKSDPGKRFRHHFGENLTFANSRISSSSQSSFRHVNLSQGSSSQQGPRELGFNSTGTLPRSKSKNQSTSDFTHIFSAKPLILSKPGTAGHLRTQSQKLPNGYYTKSTVQIPKNIQADKEVLYDQLLLSKTVNNTLQQDNNSLRTKLIGMQEEMTRFARNERQGKSVDLNPFDTDKQKYNKIFNDQTNISISRASLSSAPMNNNSIIIALKQSIKDLRQQLHEKDTIIANTAKTVKLTQIKELEIQISMYAEECLRLRRMIEQSQKLDKDQRFKDITHTNSQKLMDEIRIQKNEGQSSIGSSNQYSQAFMVLKSDNMEMAANLKRCEEENYAMKIVIEAIEKQLKSSKNENGILRRQIHAKDREIDILNGKDVHDGKRNSQFTVEGQLRIDLDKKNAEFAALSAQMQLKDKSMIDFERRTREKEADFIEKLSEEIKEKQEIQKLLDREKDIVYKLRQDLEKNENQNRRFQRNEVAGSQQQLSVDGESAPDSPAFQRPAQRRLTLARQATTARLSVKIEHPFQYLNRKRLPRVSHEEIKHLAEDLKYYLKLQRVTLNDLEEVLFKDSTNEITLQKVYDILSDYPCDMEEGAMVVARYLIEDNDSDWIQFDINATNRVPFVKSALRHLLDSYTVPTEEQEAVDMARLVSAMLKQRGNLEDLLIRDPTSKKVNGQLCCSKKQLIGLLESAEIKLSSNEIELLFTKLFKSTNTVQEIPIESIYKIISVENIPQPSETKQRKESNQFHSNSLKKIVDDDEEDEDKNNESNESGLAQSEGEVSNDNQSEMNAFDRNTAAYAAQQGRDSAISESRFSNQSRFQRNQQNESNQEEGVRFMDANTFEPHHRQELSRNELAADQTNYTQQTHVHSEFNDTFNQVDEDPNEHEF